MIHFPWHERVPCWGLPPWEFCTRGSGSTIGFLVIGSRTASTKYSRRKRCGIFFKPVHCPCLLSFSCTSMISYISKLRMSVCPSGWMFSDHSIHCSCFGMYSFCCCCFGVSKGGHDLLKRIGRASDMQMGDGGSLGDFPLSSVSLTSLWFPFSNFILGFAVWSLSFGV